MTAYTLSADTNIDALSPARTGGDTINTNGFNFTIDQDTRYGLGGGATFSLGSMTINATKGGNIEIDGRYIRLIPFNSGTGNVPAYNTTISQGSASGKLIAVQSALTATPTAVGAAMPTSGFIKIKAWNSVAFTSGALSGIGASSTGADVVGTLEIVGDEASTVNANRLGIFRMRGAWYDLGTTSGSNTTTYQYPSNGSVVYLPSIEVETGTGTGVYEVYVCAGSQTALLANVGTEADRGKVFWCSTAGVIRFQHDGTNSTGGYLPPSGRKIRAANIMTVNCTTAARGTNALPNATLGTRYDFTTTGGGQIIIDKAVLTWYPSFSQAYSVSMTNVSVATQLLLAEIAQPMSLSYIGVGQEAANAQFGLSMSLCLAGGTISNCVVSSATLAASGRYVSSFSDVSEFTFSNNKFFSFVARANATTGAATLTRVANCTYNNNIIGTGRFILSQCSNLTFNNSVYFDCLASTTVTANPMYAFDLSTSCTDIIIDGLSFGSLSMVQPYSGLLSVGAAGCKRIKMRNIGTAGTPLDLGYSRRDAISWSRATTTATITSTAHGLKTNDIIYVIISSDVSAIVVGSKTITVTNANTFTFTCLNAGGTSGTICYYRTITAVVAALATGAGANTINLQRIYTTHTRTNLITGDNSSKNILVENCWSDLPLAAVNPLLNGHYKGIGNTFAMTAQTATYGSHWFDCHTTYTPANISGVSWSRTTTTATVTSTDHGLKTGDLIDVNVSSDTAAIVLGQKSITATTKDAFTFTCLNAGGASGTLTMQPSNSRIGLVMNEATSDTTSQYTIDSGTPSFTSAGGLYMPTIGQQITFISPYYIIGHTAFQKVIPIMAGGTISNYDITYAVDLNNGSGYGSFKNAYYRRSGGGGSNASTTVTMTDTTGVQVGDYVTGTNIGIRAKVISIDSSTNITVSVANTGTVSGVLVFFSHPDIATIDASLGIKLKIRIKTIATNSTAITSLYFLTSSTETSRGYQYDLDPVTVTFTVKDAADSTVIQNARVYVTADAGGPAVNGTVICNLVTDVNGQVSFTYPYVGSQPFTGRVRKSSASPLYKTSPISGSISSTGFSGTIFMVKDE